MLFLLSIYESKPNKQTALLTEKQQQKQNKMKLIQITYSTTTKHNKYVNIIIFYLKIRRRRYLLKNTYVVKSLRLIEDRLIK